MALRHAAMNYVQNFLHGSFDSAGAEALRAYFEPPGLSAAHVDHYAPQVYEPAAARVTVRVADRVSGDRSSAAAVAMFGHSSLTSLATSDNAQ